MAPEHQEKKPSKLFSLFSRHKTSDLEQQQAYAVKHELQWSTSPNIVLHIAQDAALVAEITAGSIKAMQRIVELKIEAENAHHEFNVTMRVQIHMN